MHGRLQPERYLDTAVDALSRDIECRAVLDELPVPIYTTDPAGRVTYWNKACIEFAGREPRIGLDRWCVTWRLYTTTGEPLSHDRCPMAQALRQRRPVRDAVAVAERPDGSRVAFKPYPTPILDADGSLKGAVNMLIDVTDEQCQSLAEQAGRCRRLADATYDRETCSVLGAMAEGFETTANQLKR